MLELVGSVLSSTRPSRPHLRRRATAVLVAPTLIAVLLCVVSPEAARASTAVMATPIPATSLALPQFLAPDPTGGAWISGNQESSQLVRVLPGGPIDTVALPSGMTITGGLAVGKEGDLWFSSGGATVGRRRGSTVEVIQLSGVGANDAYKNLVSARTDGVWVIVNNGSSSTIVRVRADGTQRRITVPASATGAYVVGLAESSDGSIWIVETRSRRLLHLNADGQVLGTVAAKGTPYDVAVTLDGVVWYASDVGIGRVVGAAHDVVALPPGTVHPEAGRVLTDIPSRLTAGPAGDLWYTTVTERVVGHIVDGSIATYAVPGATRVGSYPDDVAVAGDGSLWFTAGENQLAGHLDTSGLPKAPAMPPRPTGPAWTVKAVVPKAAIARTFRQIACGSATTCIAVDDSRPSPRNTFGNTFTVLNTTDAGATWRTTKVSLPGQQTFFFYALTCVSKTKCIGVGVSGTGRAAPTDTAAAITTNGGTTWSVRKMAAQGHAISSISCFNASRCVAVGELARKVASDTVRSSPTAFTTADGGTTWVQRNIPAAVGSARLTSVACRPSGHCAAVGTDSQTPSLVRGIIRVSGDGGTTWSARTASGGAMGAYGAVTCSSDRLCIAAGYDLGGTAADTARTTDGGATWIGTQRGLGSGSVDAFACAAELRCAIFDYKGVLTSRDGGRTWWRDALPVQQGESTYIACLTASTCLAMTSTAIYRLTAVGK